jgi:predicted DNA-binding transcriptional regulator AlpA
MRQHRRGHSSVDVRILLSVVVVRQPVCENLLVAPRVNTEDLIDAQGVADLLGLAQRTAVSVYQSRYPDMPKPVVVLASGRTRLWLRSEVLAWARNTGRI